MRLARSPFGVQDHALTVNPVLVGGQCNRRGMSIFVFGSNREGRHGAGAAKAALKFHGAVYGQAEGRQGNSYAIVTKELRKDQPPVTLEEVQRGVWVFLKYAADHPEVIFQVTPIGTGLAGFKPSEIAPMFKGASSNVLLPTLWV